MDTPNRALVDLRAPDFGTGATRRRIRLESAGERCRGRLIDTFHEMTVDLRHDGRVVTAIEGRFQRNPNSSCPGATLLLDELLGVELTTPAAALYAGGRSRRHCTHLLDLAVLVLAQASRGEGRRQYDAVAPDETEAPVDIEVRRDGEPVFAWRVRRGHILAPAEFAGLPMGPGFTAWSTARLDGDALEAAQMLSRTWYISRGRKYDVQVWAGQPVSRHDVLLDRCYSYAAERAEHGVFLAGVRRDFSRGMPDDL